MTELIKPVKIGLPPFSAWLSSNIPAVYDNTMSYYEELTSLIKYLEDVVLPAVNQNGEAVSELQALVVELKSYVENYFDNLDIQEEINNKLDKMAEDGTLEEIIASYVQANIAWCFDSVNDMKAGENFIAGSYAKTYGFYSAGDGGSAIYKIRNITNEDVIDNITIIPITASNTLCAELVFEKNMVVDQFGAKGDGIHDDSDNIQAYINYTKTGSNVYLDTSNKQYLITKTLDFNGKGLIGNGFNLGSAATYGLLFEDSNNYTNNSAIINIGRTVKNVIIKSSSTTLDCIHLNSLFNYTFDSVSIIGFSTQILVDKITVATRFINSNFSGFNTYAIHVNDSENAQSTTTWFDKCEFSYASGIAIKYEKDMFNFTFDNIIFEGINGGIQAKVIYYCDFTNIWAEDTQDGTAHDWLINDTNQQTMGCKFSSLRIKTPWTNRANADTATTGNTTGGMALDSNDLCLASSTGKKVIINSSGLHTGFVDSANTAARCLTITTQANVGSHTIPIRIKAPNGQLYFENQDDSTTPVSQKFVIADNDGTKVYATSTITTAYSKQSYTDPLTSANGQYSIPRVFVYNPQYTSPSNGGYILTADTTNNEFVLNKIQGYTANLKNPSIIVSGIITENSLGDISYPVLPAFKLDEPSSGSYRNYSNASAVHIKFYKLDGTVVMPKAFTLHITEEKE